MKVDKNEALKELSKIPALFKKIFEHGTLELEVYKPQKEDFQQPHSRDEVYIIISGTGDFINDGLRCSFNPGDFLFVPAYVSHKFENFSEDFSTWVLFYGPEGGEK